MALAAGTNLGRYEIASLIETGGMDEVYLRAEQPLRLYCVLNEGEAS